MYLDDRKSMMESHLERIRQERKEYEYLDAANELNTLMSKATSGNDYDIAKLFIHMFPTCQTFTDREISLKLSEDVQLLFLTAIEKAIKKSSDATDMCSKDRMQSYIKELSVVTQNLRSNTRKKRYIAEIKMIR